MDKEYVVYIYIYIQCTYKYTLSLKKDENNAIFHGIGWTWMNLEIALSEVNQTNWYLLYVESKNETNEFFHKTETESQT